MENSGLSLNGKVILITGGARRVGRHLALTMAQAGADVIVHHANSPVEAQQVAADIEKLGRRAWVLQADFRNPLEAEGLVARAAEIAPLYALVNNAAIFAPLPLAETTLADWQVHLDINLTAPFLLSREFAARLPAGQKGRIVNINDWRAMRPSWDHFAYTITKSGLAALTRSLAATLAPNITVNELALGAILPPSDGTDMTQAQLEIPARRWANLAEVGEALVFLLAGPEYITGDTIYVDGGRHLV